MSRLRDAWRALFKNDDRPARITNSEWERLRRLTAMCVMSLYFRGLVSDTDLSQLGYRSIDDFAEEHGFEIERVNETTRVRLKD